MKGANTGGRARPATPGATSSRRSSFHVSADHSHAQCTGSLRRIVFKDLDDINSNPNPNPNRSSSLHFSDSSTHAAQQRRFSVPHKPTGSIVCGDRNLGRAPTPHASNGAAALSSISADLVRRTQGDAQDNGHPLGVQKHRRRFSSPGTFSSSRTACTSSSSSSSSVSSFLYNNSSRGSAAAALQSSVLHSASKISLPEKLASGGSECSAHMCRCSIDRRVNVAPLSTNCTTSSNTDLLHSSSDDILESRLRHMTLRSDTRAARQATAHRDIFIDKHDAEVVEDCEADRDYFDYEENGYNYDDEVPHWETYRQNEAKPFMIPRKGLSCIVGLYNEGNTCYLNSCIQCLVHTMPLAVMMLNGQEFSENRRELEFSGSKRFSKRGSSPSIQEHGSQSGLRRLNEANCLAREFRSLLTRMWSSSCPPYSVASASAFLRSVQSWDSQFSGYQQQDAQEAMRAILDGLHESFNKVKNRRYVDIYREYESRPEDELAAITWNYHKTLNDSLIQDIFCGQLQSSIECSVCKRTSHCFDPFLDLSLPLPEHGGSLLGARFNKCRVSILDCLALFVAPETLSGHDRYKCANCKVLFHIADPLF